MLCHFNHMNAGGFLGIAAAVSLEVAPVGCALGFPPGFVAGASENLNGPMI